nr:hypothetical protein [Tanacetum cinerariifolium]
MKLADNLLYSSVLRPGEESSTVCLTMNGQSGVTSQDGAIADCVKYDEESLMPACPTTVQQQQPYPIPPERGLALTINQNRSFSYWPVQESIPSSRLEGD